jgi:ADP-heptose:LPS heptosyltransferase
MGIGDDVIWLGEAWHRYQTTGQKSRPTRDGVAHTFKEAWANCDYVDMHEGVPLEERTNGVRPYAASIDYVCKPARFVLSEEEQRQADLFHRNEDYWLICPDVKQRLHYKNKDWGWRNWVDLVGLIGQDRPQQRLVRLHPPTSVIQIAYVENITTRSVRDMITLSSRASLIITTEGAWHHIAAAHGIPAVVLYGHCTSPHPSPKHTHSGTGYLGQCNIVDATGPCYDTKGTCTICPEVWRQIKPKLVYERIKEYVRT